MARHEQRLDTLPADHPHDMPGPQAWQHDAPVPLLKNLWRLTAPNAGVMTGPGTNSYLMGEPHTGFIAIDPGPNDAGHLQKLWQAARYPDGSGGNLRFIVCTHSHSDHSPGAAPLQALCDMRPPILGLPSAPTARAASHFVPERVLKDEELLELRSVNGPATAGHTLKVIHTPGHAANHVCLVLLEDGLLFSGDHILNGSTTVIDPPDGNMADYINALDRLRSECEAHGVRYILPAHGHVITDALDAIAKLKAHRLQREAKIVAVMKKLPEGDLEAWLPLAYDDVDPRIWPVARRSLIAHVERIQALGLHAA